MFLAQTVGQSTMMIEKIIVVAPTTAVPISTACRRLERVARAVVLGQQTWRARSSRSR
jgi:hypothetical protein